MRTPPDLTVHAHAVLIAPAADGVTVGRVTVSSTASEQGVGGLCVGANGADADAAVVAVSADHTLVVAIAVRVVGVRGWGGDRPVGDNKMKYKTTKTEI